MYLITITSKKSDGPVFQVWTCKRFRAPVDPASLSGGGQLRNLRGARCGFPRRSSPGTKTVARISS